jgi:hypothetical protein
MAKLEFSCPLSRSEVIETYFLEHRAKLIEIAAFLDRVDRAGRGPDRDAGDEDFRLVQFRQCLGILASGHPDRARRVLEVFSDPTNEPIESAKQAKGAFGAWPGSGDAREASGR